MIAETSSQNKKIEKIFNDFHGILLEQCQGKFKGRRPNPDELKTLFKKHSAWINSYGGKFDTQKALSDSRRANLCGADLENADLSHVNLSGANLQCAVLKNAILCGANLGKADLNFANLSKANLGAADLNGAYLNVANLNYTFLQDTNLDKASLTAADLNQAMFEVKTLPEIDAISSARNLELMRYHNNPTALTKLRKAFKDVGFYYQERQITYAIKHYQTIYNLNHGDLGGFVEGAFRYVFFDCTTLWGREPGRALLIMIIMILVFSIPYVIALRQPGMNGIWRKWSDDRIRIDLGTNKPELLHTGWRQALLVGLYFSVLSAFNIGWREFNMGNWIQRIQPTEYTLRATGWVRTVSGVQSLISVYLLAIFVLTYFGQIFE